MRPSNVVNNARSDCASGAHSSRKELECRAGMSILGEIICFFCVPNHYSAVNKMKFKWTKFDTQNSEVNLSNYKVNVCFGPNDFKFGAHFLTYVIADLRHI